MEQKIDDLTSSLKIMQDMMMKRGLLDEQTSKESHGQRQKTQKTEVNPKGKKDSNGVDVATLVNSESDTTIYHKVVMPESTTQSQEKDYREVDSEVTFKIVKEGQRVSTSSEEQIDTSDEMLDVDVHRFIADCAQEVKEGNIGNAEMDENKRDNMIKEAEAAKARMLATPGKNPFEPQHDFHKFVNCQATVVDQNYIMVGSNIDEQLRHKIINHEYIDFT